uniref:dTDP-4-dehydrorhamnose 3,5-epimerase n=1 Tax=viral metagenome TaxID=1070528 RepID=A0A6C0C6F6_9ZZZZ
MYFNSTNIKDVFTVNAIQHTDARGVFQEHYNDDKYDEKISGCKQVSYSKSNKNVVRGIHCSRYGKLIQCIHGKIIDTVFDLRISSPTYLQTFQVELSADNAVQLFVPAGCGHGFISCDDDSIVLYAQEGCYNKDYEMNVNIFDPLFNVKWLQLGDKKKYIMSDADKDAPLLIDAILINAYKNHIN